jgi:DNA-directed RNA polymerase I, II, and III subunit RPABC2
MSDDESDYYSDSTESEEESVKVLNKKSVLINPVKKFPNNAKPFGTYEEDDSDPDESEPDDADQDDVDQDDVEQVNDEIEDDEEIQIGGAEDFQDDAENEEEDSDIEIDEEGVAIEKPAKSAKPKKTTQLIITDDDDDDDEYEENYLQKFDNELNKNYITEFHPECLNHNSDEVSKLSKVIRDENNIIIDPLHKTLPYLTKYEKARILGQRAKQIETGAKPLVKVPENIIDSYVIAELELREKKIPFIIKRPIPGGAFEYWNLRDLENIDF